MYWDSVLKEVLNKNLKDQKVIFTNIVELHNSIPQQPKKQKRILNMYPLGENFNNLYLTRREAECMACLMRGETINKIAEKLNLAPRTVEFYFKNVKHKLGCRTKFDLLKTVTNSEFMRHVDFGFEQWLES